MDVVDLLKLHEGYRAHPYLCTAGKTTIAYGRNLTDVGIDEEEATWLLTRDIDRAIAHLRSEPYWLDLNDARQAVLIDMCVNMGWPRLSKFQKMRACLGQKKYRDAATQMVDSAWYTQVGDRAKRLVGMMDSGEWPRSFSFGRRS